MSPLLPFLEGPWITEGDSPILLELGLSPVYESGSHCALLSAQLAEGRSGPLKFLGCSTNSVSTSLANFSRFKLVIRPSKSTDYVLVMKGTNCRYAAFEISVLRFEDLRRPHVGLRW